MCPTPLIRIVNSCATIFPYCKIYVCLILNEYHTINHLFSGNIYYLYIIVRLCAVVFVTCKTKNPQTSSRIVNKFFFKNHKKITKYISKFTCSMKRLVKTWKWQSNFLLFLNDSNLSAILYYHPVRSDSSSCSYGLL